MSTASFGLPSFGDGMIFQRRRNTVIHQSDQSKFLAKSGRAMVRHSPTETLSDRRFRVKKGLAGENRTIHSRMEPKGSSIQLDNKISGENNG